MPNFGRLPPIAHTASYFLRPYAQTVWQGRVIALVLLTGVAAVIYAVIKRLWEEDVKKPTNVITTTPKIDQSPAPTVPHPALTPLANEAYYFNKIDEDHWRYIFRFILSPDAIRALTQTCKKFNNLINNNVLDLEGLVNFVLKNKVEPIIRDCSREPDIINIIFSSIFSLPPQVVFPQSDGPFIPLIQTVLTDYAISSCGAYSDLELLSLRKCELRELRLSCFGEGLTHENSALHQKFLYNIPDIWFLCSTRDEVEELSRRHQLKQLAVNQGATGITPDWANSWMEEYDLPANIEILLKYASSDFFQFFLNLPGQRITWSNWMVGLVTLQDDETKFHKKLLILGEYYKHHYHTWGYSNKESDLGLLLFAIMHTWGWEQGKPTQTSIDLETILMWIPDDVLLIHLNTFAINLQQAIPLPDRVNYGYSYAELFQFMQYLGSHFLPLSRLGSESTSTLEAQLRKNGSRVHFNTAKIEIIPINTDLYPTFLILGNHYKEYSSKWSPHKKAQLLKAFLGAAMRSLNWQHAKNNNLLIPMKTAIHLPESTQISFKCAVFSWIPKEYLIQENFSNDLHCALYRGYSLTDFFNFIAHLQKLFGND
jgi:hypothetical protein